MKRSSLMACAMVTALVPLLAPPAHGQRPVDSLFTVEKYLDYEQAADPQISPDGTRIVYTRRWVNRQEDRWESALWIMNADGSRNRFLTRGSGAVWSPDGTRVAYLADGEPRGTQVWVRYVDAEGAGTQVTRVDRTPANVKWSPDGTMLGFTAVVGSAMPWSIAMPSPPEGARWTAAPRVVERLHYRQDRAGFNEPGWTHLFIVPADGGTPRQLTQGEWNVGARFDYLAEGVGWSWSPDGRTIVVDGLNAPDADLRYRDSELYAVDVATGATRTLTSAPGTWSGPAISPDGRWIAFTGFARTPHTYQAEELWVMPMAGGAPRKISGSLDRDASTLRWAPDGSGVYFTADDQGSRNLLFAPVGGGAVRRVTSGAHFVTLASVARSGRVAAGLRSDPHHPADVVRIDARSGAVTQLTHLNDDLLRRVRLGAVEEVWYTSPDGARVQGWIVKPPSFDASRKYPLILEIHGGPHSMYNVGFNPMFQNFAANGYVVLYTNPRGSTGYGSAFGNAIDRAYPGVDYTDLMAGVDAVLSRGYVDPRRMYVGGCSGGGVLTSWIIGHTDRFAAAAVRCPVINWMSFHGETDLPLFTANFFEKPFWEDPAPWLRQSPIMYVGNVKTPTLLMTGDLDLRTPMPQTEEYFAALKARGVPTALLRFAGEYHGTGSKPSNWMRTQLYMMSWYERYGAKGETPASRAAGPD
ncbi:MAG TPA: S9 family peptidase [Longimicrobium sp.]|nr:S9 family peptidase [Longimicrobium sp.]